MKCYQRLQERTFFHFLLYTSQVLHSNCFSSLTLKIRVPKTLYVYVLYKILIKVEFSVSVLEANPWRDDSKPVYVLTHNENQLCTMKTRQNRRYMGMCFVASYEEIWPQLIESIVICSCL